MKFKRAGLFTKILLIVIIVYALTTLISQHAQIRKAEAEENALRQEAADKEAQNAEMRYYIENSDDDEIKEDIARDHNYVKQGEKVYKASE